MFVEKNFLLNTDSYKPSHPFQYPPGTQHVYEYVSSRGGKPETVFFGLQYYLKDILANPITRYDVEEAETFWQQHGEPFDRDMWMHIVNKHGGYLPLEIYAVPEGSVVPAHNALSTMVNTDPRCYGLPSHMETSYLRAIWYGTTVASLSWRIKNIIRDYMYATSDNATPESIDFKLHDFGARGVSSYESSAIGAAAHLVNFKGTDTVAGIRFLNAYYNANGMCGFSIPAAEHSSITSWGKKHEVDAYRNMIRQFGKKGAIFAVVSDSYDIFHACDFIWGQQLKQEVIDSGALLVIRPDSGVPHEVVLKCLQILAERFGYDVNSKGYKVLKYVRVIQGDGINEDSIKLILKTIVKAGFSVENVNFGMGGALLQGVNRDTHEFAVKACAANISDVWVDVYKQPVTSKMKVSKKGRLHLYLNRDGEFFTTTVDSESAKSGISAMNLVYRNGNLFTDYTLDEIRNRAEHFRPAPMSSHYFIDK